MRLIDRIERLERAEKYMHVEPTTIELVNPLTGEVMGVISPIEYEAVDATRRKD